ncbi:MULTISPECIES: glycosyltransferase family 2 protein [Chryseobacterium]|uniref:Glycosyltransferase involved in cell wall biosynthesis n=1 Tax=Chryseobacterium camelliae TaxID=1265445 RepID=A0ABU0TDU6_9FLAO|nr:MULTISPECIES: glycosyltransferase family 2 protein [Chryseobacterium]MDT3406972.1 glycosyltransferase involved in cell wall biosynthesis [Pseudacidovorax intermedius]MDQ1095235.1 glycosyltransferase involved in cell wall biosynthesis [Chryseobacterium camelliae]MDQ1099173.1 glycosyltransferase involved in cell wall biosynthesis [Chryseobacterium sp. SORGH_AS_1048]MDR6086522.1 glycosyltransferase involved in cell wall biosynthesis [Chryseobacterium sp. SORGH_AS_0909]MDR6130893.1 glycosyltran
MAINKTTDNKNNFLVSVIIPIFNTDQFLSETIESVLNQSLTDFELILINDGSTDNSGNICQEFMRNDNRIKYYYQSNAGVSAARNLGLTCATGQYIFFLDSDDTIDREFLETAYVVSMYQDNDITILGSYFCNRNVPIPALPTCAQFLKRDFLESYKDIQFPKDIQPCEDGLFSHQLLALTSRIGENPKAIYHYRKHENQNHIKINQHCDRILIQIYQWRAILEDFYVKYDLYPEKNLHLALFIQHEPFELRYLGMPFDEEQRYLLHNLIKCWAFLLIQNLTKQEIKMLSKPFLYFISTDTPTDFERFFKKYRYWRRVKKNILLFLIRFIVVKRIRRNLRQKITADFRKDEDMMHAG